MNTEHYILFYPEKYTTNQSINYRMMYICRTEVDVEKINTSKYLDVTYSASILNSTPGETEEDFIKRATLCGVKPESKIILNDQKYMIKWIRISDNHLIWKTFTGELTI